MDRQSLIDIGNMSIETSFNTLQFFIWFEHLNVHVQRHKHSSLSSGRSGSSSSCKRSITVQRLSQKSGKLSVERIQKSSLIDSMSSWNLGFSRKTRKVENTSFPLLEQNSHTDSSNSHTGGGNRKNSK